MQASGIDTDDCSLFVLCYPRVLGYCFNPLTAYYAVTGTGEIAAMLYEVSNTFGEHTHYLVAGGTTRNGTLQQACRKVFHVSPFNEADGDYGFRVSVPGESVCVGSVAETRRQGHSQCVFQRPQDPADIRQRAGSGATPAADDMESHRRHSCRGAAIVGEGTETAPQAGLRWSESAPDGRT